MARPLLPAVRRIGPLASLDELRQAVDDLQEFVQTREPLESGDPLDKYLTLRAAVESGLLEYRGPGGGGSGGSIGVPPGTPVPPPDYDDLTPPDPITGLTVTSLPTGFFVEFDAPSYSQGGGNAYSIIYRANYDGTPPLPTFGDSAEVGRTTERSPILVLAAEPGTISHFWAQPVSHAEDFSGITPQTPATGGTNGVSATAGKIDGADHVVALSIGTAQIASLAVTDAKIASLSADKLIANSLAVGVELKSTGFVSGSNGFYLEAGGDAEFNGIVARGTIYASAGLIGGALIGATYVQSTNYNGTGDGWKLDNANDQILAGKIRISNTGATRVFDTEATGANPVLKIGSAISILASGTATFGGSLTANGIVDTAQIVDDAVSDIYTTTGTTATVSTSVTVPSGQTWKLIIMGYQAAFPYTAGTYTLEVDVDGTVVDTDLLDNGTVVQSAAIHTARSVVGPDTVPIDINGEAGVGKNIVVFASKK